MNRHHDSFKSVLLLIVSILLQFPLVFDFTNCSAQQEGESSGPATPPTSTPVVPPTATPVPPRQASYCDGKTVSQISLADQKHDGVKFRFKGASTVYDTARNRWYLNDNGASWVCAKNPNADKLGTTGVNLASDFGHAHSDVGRNQYDGQRQWTVNSTYFANLFSGTAAKSCFLCGLIRWKKGCFPHGVTILTGDGVTYKKVEDFSAGETVWNPGLKKGVKILNISEGPERKGIVVLETEGARLRASTEHPMFTTKGFRQAQEIRVGDIVEDSSGKKAKVLRVSREKPTAGLSVINFVLERHGSAHDGLMVAEGLVVGDLIVQHEVSARRKK
jgi:hypothetical protein